MRDDVFSLSMSVRDYECDLQGVVNNAVYQNYLEHARHEFLRANGVDFSELTKAGINLVVVRAELDYKASLTSGDNFTVTTRFEQSSRLKFVFVQEITNSTLEETVILARVTGVAVNRQGRPFIPKQLGRLFS